MEIGQSAYDFNLPGVDGKTYSLKDFADKPVLVLFFWCNHCPYVKAYEDRVIQLAKELGDRAAFVAINSNDPTQYPEDSFENMKKVAQEKGYPFPYLFDETQAVAHAYKASRTPEFFVFDEERDLKYHGRFDDNWEHPNQVRHEYVREAILSLLENDIPHVSHVPPIGCTIKWKHWVRLGCGRNACSRTYKPMDREYLKALLTPLEATKSYRPKLGQGSQRAVSAEEFQKIFGEDAFYRWMGLDLPEVYVAHRVAGGITSLYRQLGIGCERLLRKILMDTLNLSHSDLCWGYSIEESGRTRRIELDIQVPLAKIAVSNAVE